ncbi:MULTISPECIES: glycosyltransferase [Nosocomiicoccus]|uniref:Glycosyltransferase n=1 Tax=Nosocomiicoccus massiliensis TaxID=1232430 RepID=A0AAF0YH27_9STAP|nr:MULTISPECIES: glycosyltransferase [Nosocomiicoccus]OFO53550.1 hypothetical protein HMPREF3029_05685 [Nosocomiicoccus sp. HMSC059G07]QYA48289.1 glycosyltransferase [Nosocomiicoccus ampullae]WOS95486.1 glycosyltransferase [Nosocomiicoccus massiliensis]
MKIVHVITSLESGGAERMLSNLVNLDNENEHVIISVLKSNIHYEINENINIIELNLKNNILGKFKMISKIISIIKKEKPDIVQTWLKLNYISPILKYVIKKPKYLINIRHGVRKKYTRSKSVIESSYLGYVDGTVFVSNASKNEFENKGLFLKKPVVINNGFHLKNYMYQSNSSNGSLKIGYVGRNHPVKNQQMLFRAFNEFAIDKNVELHIAGSNMNYESFSSIISDDVKSKIQWHGEVKDPFNIYKVIDVLVLTSKTEGYPNVIGEAMSIGVPVISTNAGESWDIIRESGFRISMNYKDLIKVLEKAYHNPRILKQKSKEAYCIIQNNYSMRKIVEQYKKYYEEVLK